MLKTSALLAALALTGVVLHPLAAAAQARTTAQTAAPRAPSATPAAAPARSAARGVNPKPWSEQDYRLGPGDKLRVEVYKQDQLSQSLQVRPDGKITVPLVGDVMAAGQTSLELRDALTASLKEFVVNPVVTVIVQEATSAQVYVIGEVPRPGPQVMNGPMTALQALASAGGPGEFADRGKIRVLRPNGGKTDVIPFDYKGALKGESQPLQLQPGDTLVVP